MDYNTFVTLVKAGEKAHVDCKIKCDAFKTKGISQKGELAKDICAMANNGRRVSYLLIGISDDGTELRSVDNDKLTDDNLQDFAKKAVLPPPKIQLWRKTWRKTQDAHKGKTFVVIKIGPNKTAAYRLGQDFINHGDKVCFRRNEVWIRRGATTDLATPEEIVNLASGKSLQIDPQYQQRLTDRSAFSRLSLDEQGASIGSQTLHIIRQLGYVRSPKKEIRWDYWKQAESTIMLVKLLYPLRTLTQDDLRVYGRWDNIGLTRHVRKPCVPEDLLRFAKIDEANGPIRFVRRILLQPVIKRVPSDRISSFLSTYRRFNPRLHYYVSDAFVETKILPHPLEKSETPFLSSTEFLVLHNIRSSPEFESNLRDAFKGLGDQNEEIFGSPPA